MNVENKTLVYRDSGFRKNTEFCLYFWKPSAYSQRTVVSSSKCCSSPAFLLQQLARYVCLSLGMQ